MTGDRVLFFAKVSDPHLFDVVEFYTGDIAAVRGLSDGAVVVENRMWQALRHPADATFAWWWASALPIVIQARVLGRPVVVTGAIVDIARTSLKGRARDRLKRVLIAITMRLATTNVVISDYEAATAASLGARRVVRLYPGVDTGYFCPGPKSAAPTAVTAARLFPLGIRRKGVDISIEASALVRRVVPDFRLVIIGPVSAGGQQYLDQLRTRFDFSGIDVRGEVSRQEKHRLFSSAWTYLQPSLVEGFGLAMAEAMAAGTVPVCSSRGSLPEVVGSAGIVVDDATPESVADAIIHLIQDDTERRRLEVAARARARDFDAQARAGRLHEIMRAAGWPIPPRSA